MFVRVAPFLTLCALAPSAWAEPAGPSDDATAASIEAVTDATAPAPEAQAPRPNETPAAPQLTLLPAQSPLVLTEPEGRPPTMKDWARDLRRALSLREFIETRPLVLAGLKLYLEAEPIAVRQPRGDASQLTVAFAPDRVVVLGAF